MTGKMRVRAKPKGRCKSTLEHEVDTELKRLRRSRKLKSYSYEDKTFDFVIKHKYTTDFPIVNKSGKEWLLEVKGFLDQKARRKLRAIRECNPDIDLRLLFPKEEPLPEKGLTQTNVQWSIKHNFKYTVGVKIPEDWLKE
jgi:hypothetical protein